MTLFNEMELNSLNLPEIIRDFFHDFLASVRKCRKMFEYSYVNIP